MSNLNLNLINSLTTSALADYTRIIFCSECELSALASEKTNANEVLETVKGAIALGDTPSITLAEAEAAVEAINLKAKAVREYVSRNIYGDHKKGEEGTPGIADHFHLQEVYTFATEKASYGDNMDGYISLMADLVRSMLPENGANTPVKFINKFARGLVVSVGTSQSATRKSIMDGTLTKDTSYKNFVKAFLANFAMKMANGKKVTVYNKDAYKAEVVYTKDGTGLVSVDRMVVTCLSEETPIQKKKEDKQAA